MKTCGFRQNPRRFPRFAVVVVTSFDEFLNDLHDFFGLRLLPEENQQPILGGLTFFCQGKVTISNGRETKTHILQTKLTNNFAKVRTSNCNCSLRIMNHSTTTTTTTTTTTATTTATATATATATTTTTTAQRIRLRS